MSSLRNRATKVVALALTLVLTQFYAYADLTGAATRLVGAAAAAPQAQGRLTTRNNAPITAGGSQARTGDTIFSGQQLQTPGGTGASVDLGPLGRVDIAPNTDLVLTFEAGRIHVKLTRGCVVVNPSGNTVGVVETQGKEIGPSKDKIDVCTSDTGAPIVGQGAAAAAGAGAVATAGTVAGAAGAGSVIVGGLGAGALITAAIVIPCRRGRNPSPGTPRGRNDECRD